MPSWPQILDNLFKILIIGGSESGKTNVLISLISYQSDIDSFSLYAKDPYETKNQLLINKHKMVWLKLCNWWYDDDMITDVFSNKKPQPIVTELSVRSRKIDISLVFITHPDFVAVTLHITFFLKISKQARTSTSCNQSFFWYWL